MKRYVLYCDESEDKGKYYGNFYGGALVLGEDEEYVKDRLSKRVAELGLQGEIKWSNTTPSNYERYMLLMDLFFELVRAGKVKVRVMFTQNAIEADNLTPEQRRNEFYLLYYQFLKHAFGLQYSNPTGGPIRLQILFDKLPNNRGNRVKFKEYVLRLQHQPELQAAAIVFTRDDLQEVDSKKHIILQCLDVVMGSMNFRLNDLHLAKPEGSRVRAKKTRIKEKLYKHINALIRELRPNFNVGESTGIDGDIENRWRHPYRHWKFIPSESRFVPGRTKK
jgi:hypothetical protein